MAMLILRGMCGPSWSGFGLDPVCGEAGEEGEVRGGSEAGSMSMRNDLVDGRKTKT